MSNRRPRKRMEVDIVYLPFSKYPRKIQQAFHEANHHHFNKKGCFFCEKRSRVWVTK
jgi:hypothetical protein